MPADEVRTIVEAEIGDDWSRDNPHGVDLRECVITPRLVSCQNTFPQLERKRDDIAQRRCAGESAAVFAEISDVQRRLDSAKRLLARGEGDEYDFAIR